MKTTSTIITSDTVLRKIYLSLYLKGLRVRGSWRPNRTTTYWPPHSYGHQRFFPVLQGCSTGGPRAQVSAGCWLSLPHLVSKHFWSPNSLTGGPKGPFCWVQAFSTTSCLQTDWISCALSYITVHAHSISPHNWPSELEWHVWSSSSENNCHAVHRSLSSSASVSDSTLGF